MRKRGKFYESIVCEYLEKRGYRIIYRNYQCSRSEIDIIALDGNIIVFIEVKGAKDISFGYPAYKVDTRKLNKIKDCIKEFLNKQKHPVAGCRIDVLIVVGDTIEHIKDVHLF